MKIHRKQFLTLCVCALPVLLGLASFMPSALAADAPTMGPVRHIVLLNLKDDATPDQLKGLAEGAKKLKADCEVIQTLELGANLASNTRNDGYTQALYVTFKTEADLKTYATHPAHEAFKKALMPIVEKVLVFDYAAAP